MKSSKNNKVSANARLSKITDLIKSNQEVEIAALARMFGVSEMTIRRDLDTLADMGKVKRTHGGAAIAEKMEFEFDFGERRKKNQKFKKMIAACAAKFVKPHDKIILDTGTTTLELANLLKDFEDITVITPSLAVASVLQFSPKIETILLGGIIRKGSPDLTGVIAESVLDMFSVDVAFQGADGIGLDGELYNSDIRIASVDKKMRQRAKMTYILSDSSKIGKTDFAVNGNLSEVQALITDEKITDEQVKQLKKTGTKIIITK
ncbi:MAG: Glucitol operon repressor [Planctomycetes bacterium ADurb.Bin401]|nr:MAG: Glucitol operon repressor [Planctomycetes bacterium ADurb.Bin401]